MGEGDRERSEAVEGASLPYNSTLRHYHVVQKWRGPHYCFRPRRGSKSAAASHSSAWLSPSTASRSPSPIPAFAGTGEESDNAFIYSSAFSPSSAAATASAAAGR